MPKRKRAGMTLSDISTPTQIAYHGYRPPTAEEREKEKRPPAPYYKRGPYKPRKEKQG